MPSIIYNRSIDDLYLTDLNSCEWESLPEYRYNGAKNE